MSDERDEYAAHPNVIARQFGPRGPTQPPLKGGSDGGNFDGMDMWQQTVETRLGELRGDIRHLVYLMLGAAVLLLVAFATGYILLSGQISSEADAIGAKIDTLIERTGQLGERIARIEGSQNIAPEN